MTTVETNISGMCVLLRVSLVGQSVCQSVGQSVHQCLRKGQLPKLRDSSSMLVTTNIKCTNVHIIRVPEGEEREKGPEKIFEEIIAENFLNLGKETVSQVQEGQRVPYQINPRRNTLRHILIRLTKIKDKEKIC